MRKNLLTALAAAVIILSAPPAADAARQDNVLSAPFFLTAGSVD